MQLNSLVLDTYNGTMLLSSLQTVQHHFHDDFSIKKVTHVCAECAKEKGAQYPFHATTVHVVLFTFSNKIHYLPNYKKKKSAIGSRFQCMRAVWVQV